MNVDLGLVLSALAVLFTLISFWWLHARLGELLLHGPQTCFVRYLDGTLAIQLTVTFENIGARPIIISGLRLRFPYDDIENLAWVGFTDDPLHPTLEFKEPIAIKGFNAESRILYFHRSGAANLMRSYDIQLEGIWTSKNYWRILGRFNLPDPKGGWENRFTGIDILGGVDSG